MYHDYVVNEGPWPSGKAVDCRSTDPGFDSRRALFLRFAGSSIYFSPQNSLSKRHLTLVCCFFESSGARTGLHIKEPQVHTELQSKMDPGMDHVHRIDVTCPAG